MGNSFFRFKQFVVEQEHCGMKVGTDGVLLGAWAGNHQQACMLDVGTGTGLVALMLAQRFPSARVLALEIDGPAAHQADLNFKASPFANRLRILHSSFQDYVRMSPESFDLITCNPPFFFQSLLSPDPARNLARHNQNLHPQEFFSLAKSCLSPNGQLTIIIPHSDHQFWMAAAADFSFFPNRITTIKPVPGKPAHRVLLSFATHGVDPVLGSLTIETGKRDQYTPEFEAMVRDFYLRIP